jgi:hypothetical protein
MMIEGELYYCQPKFRIFGNYFVKKSSVAVQFSVLHHVEFCKVPLPPPLLVCIYRQYWLCWRNNVVQ